MLVQQRAASFVRNNKPQELLRVLDIIEQELGRKAGKAAGAVHATSSARA